MKYHQTSYFSHFPSLQVDNKQNLFAICYMTILVLLLEFCIRQRTTIDLYQYFIISNSQCILIVSWKTMCPYLIIYLIYSLKSCRNKIGPWGPELIWYLATKYKMSRQQVAPAVYHHVIHDKWGWIGDGVADLTWQK